MYSNIHTYTFMYVMQRMCECVWMHGWACIMWNPALRCRVASRNIKCNAAQRNGMYFCMYLCMCTTMYVSMYVSRYVSMYLCMSLCIYECLYVWTWCNALPWLGRWTQRKHACTDVSTVIIWSTYMKCSVTRRNILCTYASMNRGIYVCVRVCVCV